MKGVIEDIDLMFGANSLSVSGCLPHLLAIWLDLL
jgi:hypothetical protein